MLKRKAVERKGGETERNLGKEKLGGELRGDTSERKPWIEGKL